VANIYKIGDLLDILDHIEVCFEKYYKTVSNKSADNNAKLLSYYLGRHHRRFLSELSRQSAAKQQKIRDRKIRRKISIMPGDWLTLLSTPPRLITGKNLLEIAIAYNKTLATVYKDLLSLKLRGDVMVLIRNLDEFEKHEAESFKKMRSMNYFYK